MEIIKRIFKRIKVRENEKLKRAVSVSAENEYYSKFFVENEQWNKPYPNNDEQLRWAGIQKFLLKITSDKKLRILDLGCGRGWLTNLLSVYGTVKGIEPVHAVVNYANRLFPSLDIISGNSETLLQNKHQGTFDLIVTSEVIEHIQNQEKLHFIRDMNLLLKDNGHVILTTPRNEAKELYCKYVNLLQPIEAWMNETEVEGYFLNNSFSVVDFSRLSKIVGDSVLPIEIYQLWLFKKNNREFV